jgi:hypothetical protein
VVAQLQSLACAVVVITLGCNLALAGTSDSADANPQLTPEMLSPIPLGPPQTLKYPPHIVRPAPPPSSSVIPSRILSALPHTVSPQQSKPTRQAVAAVRHSAERPLGPLNIHPVETAQAAHHELRALSYSPAAPLPHYCAPEFHAFMSLGELSACGLLPLSARPAPSTSDGAIY